MVTNFLSPKNDTKLPDKSLNDTIERNLDSREFSSTSMKETNKQKHGENKTGIFIIKGPYPDVRHALEKRGWIESYDAESDNFDFKWCWRQQINQETLKSH